MNTDRLIEALDNYFSRADRSIDDPERVAYRELLVREIDKLLDAHGTSSMQDRFTQRLKGIRKNPLNRFFDSTRPRMKIAWSGEAQKKLSTRQHQAFTLNEEERNYAKDLVVRVELISYAFDRLSELGIQHFEIERQMKLNQPDSRCIDLSIVRPSTLERDERWRKEVDIVMSFALYEIKSVVDMLIQWNVKVDTPELRYITKSRDRFLAHPRYGGVMRMARRGMSIPYDGGAGRRINNRSESMGSYNSGRLLNPIKVETPRR
jgi:hypothetical protein